MSESIAIGDLIENSYRITRQSLIRYAAASGDLNPVHWSDRIAKSVGLPGVIAHGMLTMALGARMLTAWSGNPDAIVDIAVRFSRPLVVPDNDAGIWLSLSGTVTEVRADALVTVEIQARDEAIVVTRGKATVRQGVAIWQRQVQAG